MRNIHDLEQLRKIIATHTHWYHKIDLGNEIVTPGFDYDALWDLIRSVRGRINYRDKTVLDIGSWDGMWAFEAETRGARLVVATDVQYQAYRNFLLCREVLGSEVIPFFNVSPYHLWERLDTFLQENWHDEQPYERLFDVVQHLGLLYHLRDPLLSLSQARSVMRTGGNLLLETAVILEPEGSVLVFNAYPKARIYDDMTTWWAPTITCLKEILVASLFRPLDDSLQILDAAHFDALQRIKQAARIVLNGPGARAVKVSRACLVAEALDPKDVDHELARELRRTYRNPGLHLDHRLT